MSPILQLLFFFSTLIIIFVSGIWLTVVFIPSKYKEYKIPAGFILGFTWLILQSSWSSYLGFPFRQSAYFILTASVLCGIIAFYFEFKRGNLKDWIPDKIQVAILSLGCVSGILVLLPVLLFNAMNPYIDGFTYISISDYLVDHSYFQPAEPNPYYPWLTQMKIYQDVGLRMGAQFFLAFLTSVFGQTFSLDLFMPALAVGQFCLVLSIWLFCRCGLSLPSKVSIIAVVFTAFHLSIPISNAISGFFPQAYGTVLMTVVFTLLIKLESWNENRIAFVLLTSLTSAALVLTYSEMLPFVVLSTAFIFILKVLQNRKQLAGMIANLFLAGIASIILSNVGFINAVKAVKIQLGAVVGWNIPYLIWDYLLTVFSLSPIQFRSVNEIFGQYPVIYFLLYIAAAVGVVLIFKGFVLNKEFLSTKLNLASLASSFIIMLVYFTFIARNPWIPSQRGHTWSAFKTLQYSFFIIPPIIAITYNGLFRNSKLLRNTGVVLLSCFIASSVIFSCVFAYASTQHMRKQTGNARNPIGEYYKLYAKLKDENRPINIIIPKESNGSHKHKQMLAYILHKHQIISDWTDDGYIYPHLLPEYQAPAPREDGITLIFNPNSENKTANMEIRESLR